MPREFHRSRRVEDAIQRILSEALGGHVRDPRLSGVAITHVSASRDLSVARIYYSTLAGEPPGPEVQPAFEAASGFLRGIVARELQLRQVPELRFFADQALERARTLEKLIDKAIRQGQGGPPEPGHGTGND
ncbi:MAG: 30S ribosome-binding factor RbfA [Gammaproteobacteria bacterium]|nr:30S ribosome-binding factor RbfA [Gammaproteobacteria bacterium]